MGTSINRQTLSPKQQMQTSRVDPVPTYTASLLNLPLFDSIVELRKLVIKGDWQRALELGSRCLGIGYAGLRLQHDRVAAIRCAFTNPQIDDRVESLFDEDTRTNLISKLGETLSEFEPQVEIDELISKLKQDPDLSGLSQEKFDEMQEVLEQLQAEALEETIQAIGKKINGTGDFSFFGNISDRQRRVAKALTGNDSMIFPCLSRGLLAIAHAGFNLARINEEAITSFLKTNYLETIERINVAFSKSMRSQQLAIYKASLGGSPKKMVLHGSASLEAPSRG